MTHLTFRCCWLAILLFVPFVVSSSAQDQPARIVADANSLIRLQDVVTKVVQEHIPHTYEDKRKWGMTTRRWDGLHVQLKGLKLATKRRWKDVNHGNWTMYRVELLDPKEELAVRVNDVRESGDGRVAFDTSFTMRVHAFGRNSKWVKGVQLYSFSADANARLTLRIQGTIGMTMDVAKLPPDVLVDPMVTSAEVQLEEFDLYRVSDVGGEVAQQLGRGVRNLLNKKIEEQNQKLAGKLNRQIDKKRDRLRFSMSDLVKSKWSKMSKFIKKERAERKAASGKNQPPVVLVPES